MSIIDVGAISSSILFSNLLEILEKKLDTKFDFYSYELKNYWIFEEGYFMLLFSSILSKLCLELCLSSRELIELKLALLGKL